MSGPGAHALPSPLALQPTARPWRRDAIVAVVALLLLLAWEASGWDLAVVSRLGDRDGFPWRDHPLTSSVLHDGGRRLAMLFVVLQLLGLWWPTVARVSRRERLRGIAATLACLATIPLLKAASATSCPWDLQQFGGVAHYVSHWRIGIGDGGPGRCFPSGHASAAFAFFSGYFVLRRHAPRRARWFLAAVVALGAAYGGAQTLRGAHYPSHTLWTAWLCWALSAALVGGRGMPAGASPQAGTQG